MLKIFLIMILGIGGAFLIVALYCVMALARHSNEQENMENTEEADKISIKKQLCPTCKMGQQSYEIDSHTEVCPYISCWKDGKCSCYAPIEKP